jgi:hypothetical protein
VAQPLSLKVLCRQLVAGVEASLTPFCQRHAVFVAAKKRGRQASLLG